MTNLLIKSLNITVLKIYVFFLRKISKFLNLRCSISQLPLRRSRITLIKLPPIDKKSGEQVETKSRGLIFKLMNLGWKSLFFPSFFQVFYYIIYYNSLFKVILRYELI